MVIPDNLKSKIESSRVLLVGAGGIGCEVLKSLTLNGFKSIDVVDLDIIDVSNLNRQFLFNRSNVGQSKSEVAVRIAESEYVPSSEDLKLKAIHRSITLKEFDIDFYKTYTFVINALDNRAARSHVNRMCLSAEVPLLESGTAGYTGQCKLIKNRLTACYECDGIQKEGKTFPTCTIRNTPSQPIHCIVWAKHLFHQLFGEQDPDYEVSPEMKPDISVIDLVKKLFSEDIRYLLSMENLWKDRSKPTPLDKIHTHDQPITNGQKMTNQNLWTVDECVQVFCSSVEELRHRKKTSGFQTWDKDDPVSLNFVVAASNLRSRCFNIERKSPFDVKSLAGNIVPAISSTNSIIAGLLVLQALRLLRNIPVGEEYRKLDDTVRNELIKDAGRLSFLNYTSLTRKDLIASYECAPPVETCLACAKGKTPEIEIYLNMEEVLMADLIDKIVIGLLHFVCPDIALDDGSGTILWSKDDSDETDGEADYMKRKPLVDIPHLSGLKDRLLISDLLQDKEIVLILNNEKVDEEKHGSFFYAKRDGQDLSV